MAGGSTRTVAVLVLVSACGAAFAATGRAAGRTYASFRSPSRNLACELADPGRAIVYCQSVRRPQSVKLRPSGRVTICRGQRCLGDPGEHTPILAYGRRVTVGRFRCTSETSGVRCVVMRTGKGFVIDRTRVRRVGG